jgi:hypothetical protein
MSDNSDRILQTYMETLLRLQRDRERDSLTQDQLRQIALDSGMTEDDLEFVHQRFVDYLNRGQGFLKYENWDGAIAELEQASALEPNNTVALNALAVAHWNRSGKGGDNTADLKQARSYAERVLKIDSTNDPAIRLMSAIQKGERPKTKHQPGKMSRMIVLGAFIIGLGFIATLFMRMSGDSDEEGRDTVIVTRDRPTPPTPPSPPEAPVAEKPAPADTGIARLVREYGQEGIGPGMMEDSRSIAVDAAGRTYVGEYSDGRIQVFDSTGKYLSQWNLGPKAIIKAMAVDRNGKLYVVSRGRILRFDGATGEELGPLKFSGGDNFTDVWVAADGSLVTSWNGHSGGGVFVNPTSKDNIVLLDQNGKVKRTMKNAVSALSDNFEMDVKVATDGLGNLYAIGGRGVYRFSSEGRVLAPLLTAEDLFHRGQDVAVDGLGRVYLCDWNGVHIYDSKGKRLGMIDVKGSASGLAVDDRNVLHVVARTKVYQYVLR